MIMKENVLERNGGKLHYWVSERWYLGKKTLFFFHGLTANHSMFVQQYSYFAGEYNIIAWDAPGHGKSKSFHGFSMDIAVEIVQMILENVQVKGFIAVGQSFGGYIPQAFMCRYPNVIEAFIGIGTSPYGRIYYTKLDFFWLRQVGWMSMCFPWNVLKKVSAKVATVTQMGYENMMQMLDVYTKDEYVRLVQDYYNAFMQDNKDLAIKCPTLISYGAFDSVGRVKKYCKMWHKNTGFELEVIHHAGHNANVDNPEETNKIIYDFIKKHI